MWKTEILPTFLVLIMNLTASELQLRMPGAVPTKPDDLICHAIALDQRKHQYIVQYEPHATMEIAHHMMVYGCSSPGSTKTTWACGGGERGENDVCAKHGPLARKIVYAWANNAPSKKLPNGVGLRVGGDTSIKYLVLQLHYKKLLKKNQRDNSGVHIQMTYTPQSLQMGFYILGGWGVIPPGLREFHMESACQWMQNYTIHPFGYRTHSHNLGRVTTAYRIRNTTHGLEWTEIGRMSPQQPQMFYPTTSPDIELQTGDILANRCTMSSLTRSEPTNIGPTNHEEMCNFYFMYYTSKQENLNDQYCFRSAQDFHWSDYLTGIPETTSTLVGVKLIEPEMEPKDIFNMR